MALITGNGQRIRLARRTPVHMRMQGANPGAEPSQGLQAGLYSRQPEDAPLRGPYETGCVRPGTLCYDLHLAKGRSDRIVTLFMQEEYIPPVTLKQVACGRDAIYGLLTDGTVIMCGQGLGRGESDCEDWTDIVFIDGCYGYVVGIKSDGSVVVAGEPFSGYLGDFATWGSVVKVSAGQSYCIGLTANGALHTATYNVKTWKDRAGTVADWTNVTDVTGKEQHIVACFQDGHVQVGGYVAAGAVHVTEVDAWTDVVQVGATANGSYGRKSDGDMLACGSLTNNYQLIQTVSSWTGITDFSAQGSVLGLKEDKTVVAAGQLFETYGTRIQDWTGILQVANWASLFAGRRSCDALASGSSSGPVGDIGLLDHCL